jgi:hypothetical protein
VITSGGDEITRVSEKRQVPEHDVEVLTAHIPGIANSLRETLSEQLCRAG